MSWNTTETDQAVEAGMTPVTSGIPVKYSLVCGFAGVFRSSSPSVLEPGVAAEGWYLLEK